VILSFPSNTAHETAGLIGLEGLIAGGGQVDVREGREFHPGGVLAQFADCDWDVCVHSLRLLKSSLICLPPKLVSGVFK